METVKKVKFPIASIFFLLEGLIFSISIISSIIMLIATLTQMDYGSDWSYLGSQLITLLSNTILTLVYFYLAIILFCKKRNGFLIGGIAALFFVPLTNFIYGFIFQKGYETFHFSFASFEDIINTLNGNYIFTAVHFLFLFLLIATVVCLVKENSNAPNLLGKIWFLPALIYFLNQLANSTLSSIEYGISFFGAEYYDGNIEPFVWTVFANVLSFVLSTIPLTLALFFLTKWLKSPYKFIKPKATKETPAPTQNVPVYENTYDNGIIIEETEIIEEKTEEVIEQSETPEPIVAPEPIVIPEPIPESEPIVIPEPISEPQQTQEVKKNENTSSIAQASNDLYTLKKLLDDGLITESEYQTKKEQLLGL